MFHCSEGVIKAIVYLGVVRDGRLLLVDYETPRVPIHVVHREGRSGSAKVRSFVDLIVARLRAEKSLR